MIAFRPIRVYLTCSHLIAFYAVGVLIQTVHGDRAKARQYYEKCLEIDPNHENARRNLDILVREMGESYVDIGDGLEELSLEGSAHHDVDSLQATNSHSSKPSGGNMSAPTSGNTGLPANVGADYMMSGSIGQTAGKPNTMINALLLSTSDTGTAAYMPSMQAGYGDSGSGQYAHSDSGRGNPQMGDGITMTNQPKVLAARPASRDYDNQGTATQAPSTPTALPDGATGTLTAPGSASSTNSGGAGAYSLPSYMANGAKAKAKTKMAHNESTSFVGMC
jgi:hypothetical protein